MDRLHYAPEWKTESQLWAAGGYSAGILAVLETAGGTDRRRAMHVVFSGPGGVERLKVGDVIWAALPNAGHHYETWRVARRGGDWLLVNGAGYERDVRRMGWNEFVFRRPGEAAISPVLAAGAGGGASSPAAAPGALLDVRA